MDSQRNESELIDQAVAGDESALERLMLMHHSRLAADLGRKLPANVRGFISVEDVLQETYVIAFREILRFQPRQPGSFGAWLSRISERRLFDAIKAERAAKRGGGRVRGEPPTDCTTGSIVQWLEMLAVHERTPSMSAAGREAAVLVQGALAGLKDEYREAIQLRYIEGLCVADAAARMKRSEGALCLLCHRALRCMRETLGESALFSATASKRIH
jgi:RNA polymerase sigma-70 factor (ECF subfamily)